tara:strand:- start:519 stop:926 length:408 start_codon:yes stop_codon:yes gene_type:complete
MLIAAGLLWMIDIPQAVLDFRTTTRQDVFNVVTADTTTANVTLLRAIYLNDTNTISYLSTISEEPFFSSYNSTTRDLQTGGLTANTTRTLTVNYSENALTFNTSLNTFLDWFPYMWISIIALFPIAALVAIFTGR